MPVSFRFSNRYVFAKVMQDNPELCRELIERILDIKIDHVSQIQVESEATSVIHRSVRFDVFVESDVAAFEVEMQTYEQRDLPRRMRFYRSQLDRRLLDKGADFSDLKPVYVIFICMDDPFGAKLPMYTFKSVCEEDSGIAFDNGAIDVVLSVAGDLSKAPESIASLLRYVGTDTVNSDDALTCKLSRAVEDAREDEEWVKNMSWLDWDIRDAKAAAISQGLKEGHAKGLEEGREEGRAEGREEVQDCTARLIAAMEADGRPTAEILAALKDPAGLDGLYKRYGVTETLA